MAAEDGEGEPRDPSPEAIPAAGRQAGKSWLEIAVELYGAERVDEEWTLDGPMRATVRRLALRAVGNVDTAPSRDGTGPRPPGRW